MQLRHTRLAHTQLNAQLLELHAAEIVLRNDVPLSSGQQLDRSCEHVTRGLGFQCAYRPRSPGNLPWPPTMARERGFDALADLLEKTLWDRFQISPDGEILVPQSS